MVAVATNIKKEINIKEEHSAIKELEETDVDLNNQTDAKIKIKRGIHGELRKHLHNLKIILECTNATTILRRGDTGYLCSHCSEGFPEPMDLKIHTLTQHADVDARINHLRATGISTYLIKLDITNLKCMICSSNIDSLEDLLAHLKEQHKKDIISNLQNHIFPFKFNTEQLTCCICSNRAVFDTFRALHEHMHRHFRNYVCNVCDVGFVNQVGLTRHIRIHKTGAFACSYCPKVLDNVFMKNNHERRYHTHIDKLHICQFCNKGFRDHALKESHLIKIHGIAPRTFKCTACDKKYPTQRLLGVHVRRFHLMERTRKCSLCDKAFFRENDLQKHMLTHTGVKEHQCEVCKKCYAKKSNLTEHMRIHNNDKRFKCEFCGQAFVQKSGLTLSDI